MTWKSTPAMAGERCIVDKVQITANDESHHSVKVGAVCAERMEGRMALHGLASVPEPQLLSMFVARAHCAVAAQDLAT